MKLARKYRYDKQHKVMVEITPPVVKDIVATFPKMRKVKTACTVTPHRAPGAGWPILSDAMGVHPTQIDEARAASIRMGVPTDFTPDGRAILTGPRHRKNYARTRGLHDRNGGYGDP